MRDSKIIVAHNNIEVLVDREDFDALSPFKWYVETVTTKSLVYRNSQMNEGLPHRKIFMTTDILHPPQGMGVTHKNGNGLDNRRENLLVGTRQQLSAARIRLRDGCSSQFKGVNLRRNGKWAAVIKNMDIPKWLGTFDREEDAAMAYDDAARELYGSLARLNFPSEGELSASESSPSATGQDSP